MASKYQKRHYEDVARILMGTWPEAAAITGREVYATGILGGLARDFANLFAADNPLFDRGRFLKACGLGTEG